MTKQFELELLDQYWINGSKVRYKGFGDLTSHGKILLSINGLDISGCELEHIDYGINQSAAALLQTVFLDHRLYDPNNPSGLPLIPHGCDLYGTCPKQLIDYRVQHRSDMKVVLDRFYVIKGSHFHTYGPPEIMKYKDIIILPVSEYARIILKYAKKALEFLPLKSDPNIQVQYYNALRNEIEFLISMVERYLQEGFISDEMRNRVKGFNLNTLEMYGKER